MEMYVIQGTVNPLSSYSNHWVATVQEMVREKKVRKYSRNFILSQGKLTIWRNVKII